MSKIKELLPEDYTAPSENDTPPEQAAYEDEQEMMREQGLWRFTTDAKELLWQVDYVDNGVRLDALIAGEKPTEREAIAAIATRYSQTASVLIDKYTSDQAKVLIHQPTVFTAEDIKDNYISF